MSETITIPTPRVPFPGGRTQGHFMREAAKKIEKKQAAGGSNVTATVVKILQDVAVQLDADEEATLEAEAIQFANAVREERCAPPLHSLDQLPERQGGIYPREEYLSLARAARKIHKVAQ